MPLLLLIYLGMINISSQSFKTLQILCSFNFLEFFGAVVARSLIVD